jgi:hypothetical protein
MMVTPTPAQRMPIAALLLALIFMPTLVFYARLASSLALGAVFAALLIIVTVAAFPIGLKRPLATTTAWFLVISLVLTLHLLIAGLLRPVDIPHALVSFAPLLLMALGGCALSVALQNAPPAQVDSAIRIGFWALVLVSLLPAIGLDIARIDVGQGYYAKPVFPFTEPSHLALILMPFFLYVCVTAPLRQRLFLLGLGLLLVIILESLVLATGWLLVALICMRGLLLPMAVVGILCVVLTQLDLTYYLERLDFSGDSQNLSTLVYLQGWELIDEALRDTQGWGQGFQQLGLLGTESPISTVIYALIGNDSNLRDGGFLTAKIVGELGMLGIALIAALLVAIVRSGLALRRVARRPTQQNPTLVFADAVFIGLFVELALRSTSYFSGNALLVVMAGQLRFGQRSPAGMVFISTEKPPNFSV